MNRRRAWWVGGSVALHLAVLALLLVTRRPEPDQAMAPNYELVFDNGGASTPSTSEQTSPTDAMPQAMAENPASTQEPAPAAAAPTPVPDLLPPEPAPPAPPAAQAEPEPPAPSQQAMALPDPTVPPSPPDAPVQPAPVQPAPVQPAPAQEAPAELPQPQASKVPPAVRLAQPDEPPSVTAMTQAPDFTLPVPPPPPPPRPRPPAPPRQALGSLSSPMDLNFGQASSRAPAPPRGSVASHAIDFSLGAPKPGPNRSEAFFDVRAANIGADWAQGLAAYWLRHRYYPSQAAEAGEDGTVKIQIVVNRLGRVQSVEVLSRSGSPWLDMAAVGTWRNAQLAPLPAENNDPTITIPLTINYVLLR